METKKDSRVIRTQHQLHDALLQLIGQGNAYSQIKIADIVNKANLSRATFYLHYRGKDELFVAIISEKIRDLLTPFYGLGLETVMNCSDMLHVLFMAIKQEFVLYKMIFCHEGMDALQANMQKALTIAFDEAFASIVSEDELAQIKVPHRLISDYLAGTYLALCQWWVANDMPEPVEHMTDVSWRLGLFGIAPFLM